MDKNKVLVNVEGRKKPIWLEVVDIKRVGILEKLKTIIRGAWNT